MAKEKAKHILFKCLGESEEAKEKKRINKEIEKQLSRDKLLSSNSIKLLLLGTGESGKSTFIKQMRIIHGDGYSTVDKQKYATLIIRNILVSMQALIKAINDLQLPYSEPTSEENAKFIEEIDLTAIASPGTGHRSFQTYHMMIVVKELWMDENVRKCFEQQSDYHNISDSIAYFLLHLDRINRQDYLPTEQDILRCRVPTSGVLEYSFNIQKHHFRIFDVGGQRTERRKWIHCFEGVTSVLFLAALSDYNETCQNCYHENCPERGQNRLAISIDLFKVIKRNPWFENSSMILFLNKKDLLEEKINSFDLKDHFPEYQGGKCNAIAARNFIQDKFVEKVDETDETTVYSHFTCATDTNNMRFVFESVRSTILEQNIRDYFY